METGGSEPDSPAGVPAWLVDRPVVERPSLEGEAVTYRPAPESDDAPAPGPAKFPSKRALVTGSVYQMALSAIAAVWCIVLAGRPRLPVLFGVGAFFAVQRIVLLVRGLRFMRWNHAVVVTSRSVDPPLREICARAGVAPPRVVVSDAIVAAGVRSRKGEVQLVLSPRFVRETSPESLRCVIAHEIAHVVARDNRSPRRYTPAVVALAGYVVAFGELFHLESNAIVPVVWAFFPAYAAVVARVTGVVVRGMEARADRGGAYLVGDARAMRGALEDLRVWVRRVRRVAFGPRWAAWLLAPASIPGTTHPTIAWRIAAMDRYAVPGAPGAAVP